jgi:hypothetical protein
MRALALALAAAACTSAGSPPDAAVAVSPRVEPGERLVAGDRFHVIVPSSWKDLPELHPAGAPGVTVGDPRQAVFLTILRTTTPGRNDPGGAPRVFFAELEKATTESGARVTRWEVEETPVGLVARTVLERGEMRAEGVRIAVVDDDRALQGFSADCLSRTADPSVDCARVIASFEVERKPR